MTVMQREVAQNNQHLQKLVQRSTTVHVDLDGGRTPVFLSHMVEIARHPTSLDMFNDSPLCGDCILPMRWSSQRAQWVCERCQS